MESRVFFRGSSGIEATYISRCVQKAASLRKHDATWLVFFVEGEDPVTIK